MGLGSQAQRQNLDCNYGCGTYAQYALAQRLHLPESIQNLPRDEIATWFSYHPQCSGGLKALAGECESSCVKIRGLDMPMNVPKAEIRDNRILDRNDDGDHRRLEPGDSY